MGAFGEFFIGLWNRFDRAFFEQDRWKMYLEGLGNTIIIALIATIIGTTIGVALAMVKYVNKRTGKLEILNKQ